MTKSNSTATTYADQQTWANMHGHRGPKLMDFDGFRTPAATWPPGSETHGFRWIPDPMQLEHWETLHFQWILTGFVWICMNLCVWCEVSLCHSSIRKPHTFNGFSQDLCGFAWICVFGVGFPYATGALGNLTLSMDSHRICVDLRGFVCLV